MKNEYFVALNCRKFFVLILYEEIYKNRNIHHYCKRNDERWFDLQNVILKAVIVVDIANLCLEVNEENEVIHAKDVAVKAIYVITLLGKVNNRMNLREKKY